MAAVDPLSSFRRLSVWKIRAPGKANNADRNDAAQKSGNTHTDQHFEREPAGATGQGIESTSHIEDEARQAWKHHGKKCQDQAPKRANGSDGFPSKTDSTRKPSHCHGSGGSANRFE
jgi:hypothetical protein